MDTPSPGPSILGPELSANVRLLSDRVQRALVRRGAAIIYTPLLLEILKPKTLLLRRLLGCHKLADSIEDNLELPVVFFL